MYRYIYKIKHLYINVGIYIHAIAAREWAFFIRPKQCHSNSINTSILLFLCELIIWLLTDYYSILCVLNVDIYIYISYSCYFYTIYLSIWKIFFSFVDFHIKLASHQVSFLLALTVYLYIYNIDIDLQAWIRELARCNLFGRF